MVNHVKSMHFIPNSLFDLGADLIYMLWILRLVDDQDIQNVSNIQTSVDLV